MQACMHAKFLQSCLTPYNPVDHSLAGSLSTGFSRQEHWSGFLCPPPAELPAQGSNPRLLCLLH